MTPSSPNKRKDPPVASSPSIKSTTNNGATKIKCIVENSSPLDNPVVVSFPSGLPESLQKGARTSDVERPTFQWEKLSQKSSMGRQITAKDKHCTYTASARGLGYDDRRTKLCVGVFDKRRGVVVIREAACKGTVFSLQQTVPSYLETSEIIQSQPGEAFLTFSTQVFEDFGSSKKRKVLKSQAANRVEIDNVIGAGAGSAVMQQVMKGESMSESNMKAIEESKANGTATSTIAVSRAVDAAQEVARRNLLPTYDVHAVKPDRVYSARDIAGEKAWARVYNKVHACAHKDDVVKEIVDSIFEKDWHTSTLKVVKSINPEKNDAKDRFTCAILVNWLIKFYTNNNKRKTLPDINETKATYFGIPTEVATRWISLFTTAIPGTDGKTSHAMSKQDRDKCVVYALLLYMMSQGAAMKIADIKPIAEDLKRPVNDCAMLLRQAGCQIIKKGAVMSAALKTPLTFPPPRRAARSGI